MPVPSLSADDLNYCPKGTYWLGGVWAPTNYMITRGLMTAGRGDVAHGIATKYLNGLMRTFDAVEPHTLWECYSPEEDLPGPCPFGGARVKPDFVGWTGIGPIAMLIENVLGFDIDVPHRVVTWDIRLVEKHGLKNLTVGNGTADFCCGERKSDKDRAEVKMSASIPLTVHLRRTREQKIVELSPGGGTEMTV